LDGGLHADCQIIFLWHLVLMKAFSAAAVILFCLLLPARAQDAADDKYVAIYGLIQQADNLGDTGQPHDALAGYTDAQSQLQQFMRQYPDWNPGIVNYRAHYLEDKIAALKGSPAPNPNRSPVPLVNDNSRKLQAQLDTLQSRVQSAQDENEALQAKLKEALSTQPAAIDPAELARAQDQIRSLMKDNDLLKVSRQSPKQIVVPDTNAISQLQSQLAGAAQQYASEHASAEKLAAENTALRRNIQQASGQDATALDLLHSENDRMKSQLAALAAAQNNAAAAGELANKLKDARAQVATLQSAASLAALEKATLENKVRKLSSDLSQTSANFAARLRDLTDERDNLVSRLAVAGNSNSPRKNSEAAAQIAELNNEVNVLRSRVAVDESKPVPYTGDELALFRQSVPQPARGQPIEKSVAELPAGSAELVASAQRHFASHEFDEAEADYMKILQRGQNNGLVLANLATIELQQGKLDDAEKHIQAALAQSPDDAYNLSTLGYLKFREEKYDDALDALSRAAKLDPQNPEIENYLGVTLSHKGLRAQAETALRQAIQINPNYAPAHNNLAVIYLSQEPPLPQLARWHYQKALDGGQPRNPDLEKLLAEKGAPVPQ
jgi:Tfp pilus assembly protein PilF